MKLKYDPFPLVFAQGDEMTRLTCLDLFNLGDSPQARACLLSLIKRQRPDGSFPSRYNPENDPENWGMLETVRNAILLLKFGLPPAGVNVDSAVKFISAHQNPDGGWRENRSLEIPQELQVALSSERSATWLTADVVELLRRVGMEESGECRAALKWLRTVRNRRGGWPSFAGKAEDPLSARDDPDASAQITFLMGEIYGEEAPVYLKGRELVERYLDECAQDVERGYRIRLLDGEREALDVYGLTHLLLSWLLDPPRRLQSGYDASDPRVKRMMEALVDIQREDGSWSPFWTEESSPVYTALAVKVLILSGMLAREDLEAGVKAHVV